MNFRLLITVQNLSAQQAFGSAEPAARQQQSLPHVLRSETDCIPAAVMFERIVKYAPNGVIFAIIEERRFQNLLKEDEGDAEP